MGAYYIFVLTPGKGSDRLSADEVLHQRITEGVWPLNKATRHQQALRAGDAFLVYVSGSTDKHSGHFLALGEVGGTRQPSLRTSSTAPNWLSIAKETVYDVPIRDVQLLSQPVPVKDLLSNLTFIMRKDAWGSHFHGGIVKIAAVDFSRIVATSTASQRSGRW